MREKIICEIVSICGQFIYPAGIAEYSENDAELQQSKAFYQFRGLVDNGAAIVDQVPHYI
jgi:hypothetical protein